MKKISKIVFGVLLALLIVLYLGIVCVLPAIVNNKATINKLESLILEKTGIETTITGLNIKISPKLVVYFNIDSLDAKNNNTSAADIKNFALNYKLLQKNLTLVSADNIFIDGNCLKGLNKKSKRKSSGKFEPNDIPEIHIKKCVFKSDKLSINAENIDTKDNSLKLKAKIDTPALKETLKLGDSGSLQVAENELRANKFEISLGNSHLYLDGILVGKNKSPELEINGKNLPASEIMPILLHLQKSKDPSKKFIENFKNFKGTANVNLKWNKDGIWGTCTTYNLGANAVWFDIPLFFKEAVFNFRGQTVDSKAVGILGKEKVTHTLNITDLLTPEKKLVVGEMFTTLTPKFDYVPNLTVLNSVNFNLVYKIKNRKPDVYYNVDIPVKSDLIYNSFFLGLRDYKRKIYGNTFKDDNDLYLKEYKYSYFSDKENVILYGDGLFIKNIDKNNPDKFIPQYLTIRTNGYAPTSVIGAFGEKVRGGEFKGDLKYDFKNNQVLGTFDIIKARHKAFKIDTAHVVTQNGIFKITSKGFYKGEKYSAELSAKNNIFGETLIYDMKLFLDKLVLETTADNAKSGDKLRGKGGKIGGKSVGKSGGNIDSKEFSKKVKESELTINNWEIAINEIIRDKFVLKNVKLVGSLKKHIFKFKMNDLNFADGIIKADGVYDFAKNISKMAFEAKNINSNKVAEMTLNLKDQIEGIAQAKVDINAKDMFKFIDAHCVFEVKEGFLPKLGDTEFMIKDSKYKLSEITNFDLSQKDLMKDDIKGSFDVHNTELKNIDITTWHKLSAMFLEGNYEMEKQYADLQLFWKYSKEAPKGIRIFGVPLNLILKVVFRPENSKEIYKTELSKIPNISSDEKNTIYYRIHLNGDINNNKINLKLKEIR
ncbi:hypothetical protein IKQ21_03895 [bacterium]|nr:hypothetical protein [bacterium]